MNNKKSNWSEKSRHERGYGKEWDRLRKVVILRDKGLCQPCREEGRATPANIVDHILNKASGGTDDLSNLRVICRAHHDAKTIAERGHQPRQRAKFNQDGSVVW